MIDHSHVIFVLAVVKVAKRDVTAVRSLALLGLDLPINLETSEEELSPLPHAYSRKRNFASQISYCMYGVWNKVLTLWVPTMIFFVIA